MSVVYRVNNGQSKGDLVVKIRDMKKLITVKRLAPTPWEKMLRYDRHGKVLSTDRDPYREYRIDPKFLIPVGIIHLPPGFSDFEKFRINGFYLLTRYHGKSKEQVTRLIATEPYSLEDYTLDVLTP